MPCPISPKTRCCPCWAKWAADITMSKSPEEIRMAFNIKHGLTPEEEKRNRQENERAHDNETTSIPNAPSRSIPPCPCPCHRDSSSPRTSAPLSPHELVAFGTGPNPCVFHNPFDSPEPAEASPTVATQFYPPDRERKSTAGFFKKHDKLVQDSISKEGPYISRRAVSRGRPREPFKARWVGVALPSTPPESSGESPRRVLKRAHSLSSVGKEGELPEGYFKKPRVARSVSPSDGDDEPETLLRNDVQEVDEYRRGPLQERWGFRLHRAPKWHKESCTKYHYPSAVRAATSMRDQYMSDRYAKVESLLARRRVEKKDRSELVEQHEPEDYFGRFEEEDEPHALCRRWEDDSVSDAGSEASRRSTANGRYRHRQELQDQDLEEYHLHREHLRHQHIIDRRQAAEDREIEIRDVAEQQLAAERRTLHGIADAFDDDESEGPEEDAFREGRSGSTSSSCLESYWNDSESEAGDARVDGFAAPATEPSQEIPFATEISPTPVAEDGSSDEAALFESQRMLSEQSATDHSSDSNTQGPDPEATPENRERRPHIMMRAQELRDFVIMPGNRHEDRPVRARIQSQIKQQTNGKDKRHNHSTGTGDKSKRFRGYKMGH
ncbi:hypothetical protein BU16DRAFT_134656 [Lophium mytilinum]|uniref:SKP1 component dimerisation domain-containing protein n=1 Tax=Lophium mytilinum TaxID=390894 RepID=A0A6A6QEF3_9PEZI|nr:hypothetical protein BU16DRAFT_134656 [Lophium mytilinum]